MSIVQQQQQSAEASKIVSEGEDFSDTVNDIANFESDANKTATSSSHQDSEYDTASDSQSSDEADPLKEQGGDTIDSGGGECNDLEVHKIDFKGDLRTDDEDGDYDEDDDEEDDELTDDEDDGSIILDLERQRGDGEEHDESKKVDDDEDRSNPQYIPKRGVFYEHDDRTADEPEANAVEGEEDVEENKPQTPVLKKPVKKTVDRWSHDFYDESAQAPKSRAELVNSYGYDIRNEDGPPKTRRKRRYNRGPTHYTRKWEDESAYVKQNQSVQRNPRPEEFPELGQRNDRRNRNSTNYHDREEKENKSQPIQQQQPSPQQNHYQNEENAPSNRRYGPSNRRSQNDRHENARGQSNHQERGERGDRGDRGDRVERGDRGDNRRGGSDRGDFDYDRRNNKGEKNDRSGNSYRSGRNTIEFKNQNRNRNGGGGGSNDYEVRGNSGGGGNQSRNNSDNKSYNQSGNGQHQYSGTAGTGSGNYNDSMIANQRQVDASQMQVISENDLHRISSPCIDSVSFTNSKLQTSNASNNNRYIGENEFAMANRPAEFAPNHTRLENQPHIQPPAQRPITGRQQQQQQPQSQPPLNEYCINSMNVAATQYMRPQMPPRIQSPTKSQQPLAASHMQQPQAQAPPPNVDYHAASGVGSQVNKTHHETNRPKRYSSQRQRSVIDPHQQQQQQQQLSINEIGMIIQQQGPPPQIPEDPSKQNYAHQKVPPPTVAPSAQYPPANYYNPAEYAPNSVEFCAVPQFAPVASAKNGPVQNSPAVGAPAPVPHNQPPYGQTPQAQPPPYMQTPNAASVAVVQQMMNFVSAHSPLQAAPVAVTPPVANAQVVPQAAQGQFPTYPTYPGVQNYNSASGITQSGITYYAPQTQPPPRPILSQRRPTNAIPILAPPDHSNKRNNNNNNAALSTHSGANNDNEYGDEDGGGAKVGTQMEHAENIDHILDNMFVQRAPHFPPTTGLVAAARKSSSPAPVDVQKTHLPADLNAVSSTMPVENDTYAVQPAKLGPAEDVNSGAVVGGANDQQKGISFGDIDIAVAKLSINDEKISSQNFTVVHDTDSVESIENSATIANMKSAVESTIDESKHAHAAAVDESATDIVKSITVEIMEQASNTAAPAAPSSDVDVAADTKTDGPSLMQVLTPENVVLPAQPLATETTTISEQ